ncbi:MAG: PTS sugar transporter subunit IIA [Candidatus Latescibacteria bacterium]|nr:PTS sugar transporter subunit IIA [Candidatus Latescibacterota bacterium]
MICGLKKEAVAISNEKLTKEEALNAIIRMACNAFQLSFENEIRASILERENKLSTGIGLGIAVPHCRIENIKSQISAILLIPEGIEYNSVDGRPVNLMFLIISPQNAVREHIACLSAISLTVSDEETRQNLINSTTGDELFEKLKSIKY